MDFVREFWMYLKTRKKFWLLPLILVLLLFGGMLIVAKGSVMAPFIYTVF